MRSARAHQLAGKRFGLWMVQPVMETRGTNNYWLCYCDCGTFRMVRADCLVRGVSLGCGCLRGPLGKEAMLKRAKNIAVQYRYWNQTEKKFSAWEHFGYVSKNKAQSLLQKTSATIEYRIKPRKRRQLPHNPV